MEVCNRKLRRAGLALTAGVVLALGAGASAYAQNPCKSENPLDYDEALRRADCGDADKPGWGTYDYDTQSSRLPDGDAAAAPVPSADYSYLPTSFSGWYNGLSAADKRKFNARLLEEAGAGDRQMSEREMDALLTLISSEIDSYFASEGLSADERRRAIAEIAIESGVGLDGKRGEAADEAVFGRDDAYGEFDNGYETDSGYDGWQPLDPTEDFGRPDEESPYSDLDLEGY